MSNSHPLASFTCPCGAGCGQLISGVTEHDAVTLEMQCPNNHMYFLYIACDMAGGRITQTSYADPEDYPPQGVSPCPQS